MAKSKETYQIRLLYGYEDHESGIYHAFLAEDPDVQSDNVWEDRLAEMLGLDADDESFDSGSMYIELPQSLVDKIREDTVRRGHWLPVDEKEDAFDCSECDAMVQRRHNFCPKCGAKMDVDV